MYSSLRLTALATKHVEIELEKFDVDADLRKASDWETERLQKKWDILEKKLQYIDSEISIGRDNMGPEMSAYAGNIQKSVLDQLPPDARKELGFDKDDPDEESPPPGH